MNQRVVVAVAGGVVAGGRPRVHDAEKPLLLANDLAAVRGDGCFETLLVREGRALKVHRHLDRLSRSAAMMDLVGPSKEIWMEAISLAEQQWGCGREGALRCVLSRGPEHGGPPTAFITVAELSPHIARVRKEGISVRTLNRGYSTNFAQLAPWQLIGAKTLSYATNMAALRQAALTGDDEVLYVSTEGKALEGPRSTLVLVRAGRLISPPSSEGILESTTLAALVELAREREIDVERVGIGVDEIHGADSAWFISSVTLASRINSLDGVQLDACTGIDINIAALVAEAVSR